MLLAPFLWIFCEFDEKVLDNLSLGLSFQDLRFIRIFRIRKLRDKCWYLGWKSSQGEDTKVCIF